MGRTCLSYRGAATDEATWSPDPWKNNLLGLVRTMLVGTAWSLHSPQRGDTHKHNDWLGGGNRENSLILLGLVHISQEP